MYKKKYLRRLIHAALFGVIFTVFPASALWGEEIIGREVNNFSGTLQDGVPVEHRVFAGVKGTMNLTLSFVGGSSAIQLEVLDSRSRCIFSQETAMANKFAVELDAGGYLLRLTPIMKTRKDLPYELEALMPKTTYINLEEEMIPMAAPEAETPAIAKPIPFKAYVIFLLLLLWGWLSVVLYRFLTKKERRM